MAGRGEKRRHEEQDGHGKRLDTRRKEDEEDDAYDADLLETDGLRSKRSHRKSLYDLDEASDEEDDERAQAKRREPKKTARMLRRADVEGQEEGDNTIDEGGHVLEAFNMNEELELGDMDESGAYTLKKDAHESNDSWLSSITTHDIKKAQAAQAARNEREKAAALSAGPELDKVALLKQAIDILQPGENAVRALKRLGGSRPSAAQRLAQKKSGSGASSSSAAGPEAGKLFDRLSESCDGLMSLGMMDVYSDRREALEDAYRAAKPASPQAGPSAGLPRQVQWEYKWSADADQVYGPFDTRQMMQWQEAGIFRDEAVVRRCGRDAPFGPMRRVDFSLFLDDDS